MTNEEAIERLKKRICCERPVQHFCRDDCMHGIEECEIAMAIDALEHKTKHGEWIEHFDGYETIYTCSQCKQDFVTIEGTPLDNMWNYCMNCGARIESIRKEEHDDDERSEA